MRQHSRQFSEGMMRQHARPLFCRSDAAARPTTFCRSDAAALPPTFCRSDAAALPTLSSAQRKAAENAQGTECPQNVSGPPSFWRPGHRTTAERARTTNLWAGRTQNRRRMCPGRHPPGGQDTESPQNVPGPPSSGRARHRSVTGRRIDRTWACVSSGLLGNRTATECARATFFRTCRAQICDGRED